jgi:hypothetical protein
MVAMAGAVGDVVDSDERGGGGGVADEGAGGYGAGSDVRVCVKKQDLLVCVVFGRDEG